MFIGKIVIISPQCSLLLPIACNHERQDGAICNRPTFYLQCTVYPKKYAHGFCFAVFCCGYTLTDFPISIRLTSLAFRQSNDCPSASKATLMNMDKYFMWIHYERLHNHNKARHNKTVCIFLGIYCMFAWFCFPFLFVRPTYIFRTGPHIFNIQIALKSAWAIDKLNYGHLHIEHIFGHPSAKIGSHTFTTLNISRPGAFGCVQSYW